jgi:phage shock protein C
MYCTGCGNEMGGGDRFCAQCGKAGGPGGAPPSYAARPRFARAMSEKKIAGVCAGIARHLDLDVTLVRVVFIGLILFKLLGLLIYLVLWAAMARDDQPVFAAAAPQRS